jgi:hypothetical protein
VENQSNTYFVVESMNILPNKLKVHSQVVFYGHEDEGMALC